MEALIRALPQLEARLEKASGVTQVLHKHATAHGYVSSEPNDVATTGQLPKDVASSNSSEWTSSSSKSSKEM